MKHIFLVFLSIFVLIGCQQRQKGVSEISSLDPVNWKQRSIELDMNDSLLVQASSYLSVYSEIYQLTQGLTYSLTATVSIRNISSADSVFITRADYYNTQGDLIRTYLDNPIYVKPLETIEIVIDERDKDGGTGANFIFEWATRKEELEPHFEAVMISTTGQQGISFTTQGIKR
uniref:DUF3124 domain-containing protein n=1 Tax=Roseihalotalea indica TaxID=2867963 RepID=A0AA49JGT8_9BACT|nr:DUF3124 domain-containing protein [Tunicatimonas sp. TK19036]